jgi:hypothetical protein
MRFILSRSHFAVLFIPMTLAEWTKVPIQSRTFPDIKNANDSQIYQTKGSAGGLAYFFRPPLLQNGKIPTLSWTWVVKKHPASHPTFPLDKDNDDYALRVGAVLSNSKDEIKVPSSMVSLLKAAKDHVSYVIFYCATRASNDAEPIKQKCGISPYNDHIMNCLMPVSQMSTPVRTHPVEDAANLWHFPDEVRKSVKMIGIWTFADSDNTHSESEAEITKLKVTEDK